MTKRFKKFTLFVIVLLFSAVLSSCSFLDGLFNKELDPSTFDDTTKEMLYMLIGEDELTINYLISDRESFGLDYYEPYLPTPSVKSIINTAAINAVFGRIKNYDYEKLNDDQKMTYNLIVNLVDSVNAETSEMSYLSNNYLGSYLGYQAQLPLLLAEYNFNSKQDVENYIKFIELVPETFKNYYDFEVKKAEKGYGMPDFVIENVVEQCEKFISSIDNNTSFMFKVVNDKINNCEFLSPEDKTFFIERNNEVVKASMREGYAYVKDNLPNLKGKATNNQGLAHYKTSDGKTIGKDYYQLLFKDATGYDISCDEAVDYIKNKINEYMVDLRNLTLEIQSSSTLTDEYQELMTNEKFMSVSTPLEQLYSFNDLIEDDFPSLSVKPEITVKYIDESMQDNFSPAAYMTSPIDKITTETIYLNPASIYLFDEQGNKTEELDTEYLYTTLAHEGLPGHLYQNAYFKALDVNPIRKVLKSSGYVEGWATYAENYSYRFLDGKYSQTIIDYLITEQKLIAAIYSRIDLGIHHNGWTIEEMHNFMSQYFSVGSVEDVKDAYEQLVEIPTNYQEYFFTYLKLSDMYDAVVEKQGASFNAKEFHKLILDCGPAPLRFVEDIVYDTYGIK